MVLQNIAPFSGCYHPVLVLHGCCEFNDCTKLKTVLIIQCHACEIKEQTINMLSEFALY